MDKPIVNLKANESVVHPSGKLEKSITKEVLEREWKTYIYTHSHLYANAERLRRQLSMQGKVTKTGTKVNFVTAKISGQNTLIAHVPPHRVNANEIAGILNMATSSLKITTPAKEEKIETKKKGK